MNNLGDMSLQVDKYYMLLQGETLLAKPKGINEKHVAINIDIIQENSAQLVGWLIIDCSVNVRSSFQ